MATNQEIATRIYNEKPRGEGLLWVKSNVSDELIQTKLAEGWEIYLGPFENMNGQVAHALVPGTVALDETLRKDLQKRRNVVPTEAERKKALEKFYLDVETQNAFNKIPGHGSHLIYGEFLIYFGDKKSLEELENYLGQVFDLEEMNGGKHVSKANTRVEIRNNYSDSYADKRRVRYWIERS